MKRLFLGLVLCLAAATAFAQEDPAAWSVQVEPTARLLKAGDVFNVLVTAKIDDGWHLYSLQAAANGPKPTRIIIPEGQPFEPAGDIQAPPPLSSFDPNFGFDTEYYERAVTFTVPVRMLAAGKLLVQVRYQTCTAETCLAPKLLNFELSVASDTKAATRPAEAQTMPDGLTAGWQVPDFAFTDFTGKKRKFSEYRGKYVLLDFWATWCSPCLADMPRLRKTYDQFHAQGFEILGMNSETIGQDTDETDKQTQAQAKKVAAAKGAVWTHATSATAVPVAGKLFKVSSLPTKILVDKEGKFIAKIGEKDDLAAILSGLLAQR
jgi:thiol-disulfide isomerase/thioredoxin